MIINIGYVNRVLTYVPNYLFGMSSFVIYIFLYVLGVSFLFREKGFKIRFNFPLLGFLLFFVGSLIFVTMLFNSSSPSNISATSFNDMFNHMVANTGTSEAPIYTEQVGYFGIIKLNMFSEVTYLIKDSTDPLSYTFGGGYLGNLLTALMVQKLGATFAWAMGIVISLLGVGIFFIPTIRKAIKKHKSETVKEPKTSAVAETPISPVASSESTSSSLISQDDYKGAVSSISLVKEAGKFEEAPSEDDDVLSSASPHIRPIFGEQVSQNTPIQNGFYPTNGGFVRARMMRAGENPPPSNATANQEKKEEVVEISGEQALLEANERQTKAEQLTLDFDAKPVIDTSLATKQPEFIEPHAVRVSSTPTPVVEEKKEEAPVAKPLKWIPPSAELLDVLETQEAKDLNEKVADERQQMIDTILNDFHIRASVADYVIGPSVTRFNINYDSDVSSKAIMNLVDDLSRRLGGVPARFEPVVEGQIYSGLEIPNATITPVSFREIYDSLPDVKKHPLAVAFGKSISGKVVTADFDQFPHVLVAGTTGSGKSIFIHSLVTTIIMRNSVEDVRFVIVDPKQVEMVRYRDMPHLLCPIITEPSQAAMALNKLVDEMKHRYDLFAEAGGCTSVPEYNEYAKETGKPTIPYIIVILDEFGDLFTNCKEVGKPVFLLGGKARACGIHMLVSTQSPTREVITGPIKNNLGVHVALQTANYTQSITILGEGGAEKLLGKGDMLVQTPLVSRVGLVRLQGCYISRKETLNVVNYLKQRYPTQYWPDFMNLEEQAASAGQEAVANGSVSSLTDPADEEKYQAVKEWVMSQNYMSMSRIQGDCSVGFNRARRFFTRLQQEGIVALDVEGNKGCPVLIHDDNDSDSIPTSDDYSSIGGKGGSLY